MPPSHRTDRGTARYDLCNDPRLVLCTPPPPTTGSREDFHPTHRLGDSIMHCVHSKPNGQSQTVDSQIRTPSGRWPQNTAYPYTRASTEKFPGTAETTSVMLLPRRQAAMSGVPSHPRALTTRWPFPFSASERVWISQPDGPLLCSSTPCIRPRVRHAVINAQMFPPPADVPNRKTRDGSPPNAAMLRLIHSNIAI